MEKLRGNRIDIGADFYDLQRVHRAQIAISGDDVPDEYISESSVVQYEGSLTIEESQISDLGDNGLDINGQLNAGGTGADNFTISTFDQGLAIADRTANNDPYIAFWEDTTYTTRNGFLQVADSGTFLRSEVNGARVNISAKDAGGTIREILNGDPDDNTDLNGDTGIRFQIAGITVGGFSSTISYVALPFYLKERAAAASDIATYGQLWVKNTTPCELWFTDDAGTDTQIV